MKYFIALSALVLAASAMPTEIGKEDVETLTDIGNDDTVFFNVSRNIPFGQAGFATRNGGTRGGAGGAVWTVWDSWALRDAISGNAARIVYIRGRIDLTQLFTASPGVRLPIGNHKTLRGVDRNAMIFGGGVVVSGTRNVIIENIRFHNALSYAPGERPNGNGGIIGQVPGAFSTVDNIGIDRRAENVWINHCEFADDPWNAATTPADRRRHDGLLDITQGASWISVSNSIFRNHNMVGLVGNDDNNAAGDNGRLKVTYYLNWFRGTTQRNPRVRFGEVHVVNNLYTDVGSYGIGIGVGARVIGERNVFINTRRAWGWASGRVNGFFRDYNNILRNSGFDSGISNAVNWNPTQYYPHSPMAAANVEAHVRRHAGTR